MAFLLSAPVLVGSVACADLCLPKVVLKTGNRVSGFASQSTAGVSVPWKGNGGLRGEFCLSPLFQVDFSNLVAHMSDAPSRDAKGKIPMVSSVLATAGGLFFAGEGDFNACAPKSDKFCGSSTTGAAFAISEVTYRVIAVPVRLARRNERFAREDVRCFASDTLVVFSRP